MKTPITFYWTTSNDMKSEQNSGKTPPTLRFHHHPYTMYVATFWGLSYELKLCIDAFWANNLHRNKT